MKLSERLEIHAKDVLQAANPNDDMVLGYYQLSDLAEALTEAVALAKRYEHAPVADLTWNWFSPVLGDASIRIEDPEQIRAFGAVESKSRVRIVLDKEG